MSDTLLSIHGSCRLDGAWQCLEPGSAWSLVAGSAGWLAAQNIQVEPFLIPVCSDFTSHLNNIRRQICVWKESRDSAILYEMPMMPH